MQPCKAVDAEVVHHGHEARRLVVRADAREDFTMARARRAVAAAEEIEPEHPESIGVERLAGSRDLVPPARHAVANLEDVAAGRNATEYGHDRSTCGAGDPIRDFDARQLAAEVQRERLAVEDEDALVARVAGRQHDRTQGRCRIHRRRIGGAIRCDVFLDDRWVVARCDGRRHGCYSNSR